MANQAGYYRTAGTDLGSGATIEGAASVPSDGGVIATVRIQSDDDTGLYQFGYIKEGTNFTSDCGSHWVGYMAERKATNVTYYLCDVSAATFGNSHHFSVKHIIGQGWEAVLDGNNNSPFDGPFGLGFGQGNAFASAEYNGTSPNSYVLTWGPSGGTKWQYENSSGWYTVTSATPYNEGGWSIGALPSPFNISR
ncbi:MAG: hypothetical protein M3P26_15370 [Gemmatimonadota bacterium]|nr:hypothetical protein [Gemmatimonadota bacterium]